MVMGFVASNTMAQKTTADGGRTENKRFTDDVSGDNLIEGDRIAKELVARTPGQLGQSIYAAQDAPETQLVAVTEINTMDDVHSAILVDTETETFIRASCHNSQQAWSQAEADWTVRDVGKIIQVSDAEVEQMPDNGFTEEDDEEHMQTWVEVLFYDLVNGHFDYHDERKLEGSTLRLYDPHGPRKGYATVELED